MAYTPNATEKAEASRPVYCVVYETWHCGFTPGQPVDRWHWSPHVSHAYYDRETAAHCAKSYGDSTKYRNVRVVEV